MSGPGNNPSSSLRESATSSSLRESATSSSRARGNNTKEGSREREDPAPSSAGSDVGRGNRGRGSRAFSATPRGPTDNSPGSNTGGGSHGASASPAASNVRPSIGPGVGGRGRRGRPADSRRGEFQGHGMHQGGGGLRSDHSAAEIFVAGTPPQIDDRLSTTNELIDSFKQLEIRDEMPLRPGYGTLGKEQTLRANFFAVRLPKYDIYDYKVSISPKPKGEGVALAERKGRIFFLLEQHEQYKLHVGHTAHDRSQRIVSAKELPQPFAVAIQYYEHGEAGPSEHSPIFTVDISLDRKLHTEDLIQYLSGRDQPNAYDSQPLISALNLVMQQHASKTGFTVNQNRYFFPISSPPLYLSLGVEAWKGFFISVRPNFKQVMVNVNVCMSAFYVPGNLAAAIFAFREQTSGGMPDRFVQNLKVATTYLGYTKKKAIFRISNQTARQAKFKCEKLGGTVTVEEYFKREYNITLKHAKDLPVVDLGNKSKSVYVPAELCEIFPGQLYGQLNARETAQMIKYACKPPASNARDIVERGISDLGLRPDSLAAPLEGFGMTVDPNMTVIPSRVLPAPQVSYRGKQVGVKDGSWNILNVKLHSGAVVKSWAVMIVQDGGDNEFNGAKDPALNEFLGTFVKKCGSSGMTIPATPSKIMTTRLPPPDQRNPPADPNRQEALDQIKRTLEKDLNLESGRKPSFVLVLLSNVDNFIYPGIKQLCDVQLGVHTLHMLMKAARSKPGDPKGPQRQDQYFSNVTLKLNAKLGGTNHLVDSEALSWLTNMETMMVGIDVTHPGPSSMAGAPSIAAVVASVDNQFVQFPVSLSIQKPDRGRDSREMVKDLTQMMIERLQLYQKRNGRLPDRILIYRDGVSEGQYHLVLSDELPLIRDAFKIISPEKDYSPKMTIVVCGKRHHARFYPTDSKDASKNGNTLPGTIVDKGITDVYHHDYYLQAHAGLQGQVRPTHYFVVYDDVHYDADTLQQGTHVASYLYARATKAVSLVPAAYYADLACERARFYLNALMNSPAVRSATRGGKGKGKERLSDEDKEHIFQEAKATWGSGIHPDLSESMFYI